MSCILSQNTADANSFPTFIRLRAAVSDWAEMESMPVEELEILIKKAGLAKQKARSIQAALRAIREKFGDYALDDLRNWEVDSAGLADDNPWSRAKDGINRSLFCTRARYCAG
ncbi:MAG: hypothetical protein R2688_00280 [Fimbriimonadaceae bacterium]